MKYSKIFQFAYLVFAVLFLYDGITKWGDGTHGAYVSFALAGLAVFIFFFRRKFANKYGNKNKS
ncbi:hypothetical protein [Aestuariibaculum sediminum]|uniref:Uncharacterized protein n=1 Tax=Aestuariibaculum sediminum TaxID=2770637 RepID=A0A8J6Q2Q6_9FLAO|nr:hypothetical protein [Aestuariibaculum sediminum]MBD0832504.1 hypothetical protein [Aestuariibaculum sediminum]